MKKILFGAIAMMMLCAPAYADYKNMWADVYSWDGKSSTDGKPVLVKETTGITFKVLQAGTDTAETTYVYQDDTFTSLTNPVTAANYASSTVCNGRVQFRVDPGASDDESVDLIVVNSDGGYTSFVEDFNQYTHTIIIDERPNIQHTGMIWYGSGVSATEVQSGVTFQYDTLIQHVQPEVVTVDSGVTLNVGLLSSQTNGDADGFILGASMTTAGYPLTTLATSGALMDDGTNFDPDGHYVISANAQQLTYTLATGGDTAVGYIHYNFVRVR